MMFGVLEMFVDDPSIHWKLNKVYVNVLFVISKKQESLAAAMSYVAFITQFRCLVEVAKMAQWHCPLLSRWLYKIIHLTQTVT